MFPLLSRMPLSRKPASTICSLHRALLLSLKNSHLRNIHVISAATEMIKPSSPTPTNLNTFKLSLIDNNLAPIYVPFVFFYPAPGSRGSKPTELPAQDRLEVLKSSLAKALTRFYPLAGRLSNEEKTIPIVRCNDEGVPFSSATIVDHHSLTMADFLSKPPEIDSLHEFLPFPADMITTPSALESAPQIAFRATAFPCGGVAIGVCMLHKIIDGCTLGDFMKLWSAVARSNGRIEGGGAYAHDRAATSFLPARHDDVADVIDTSSFVKEEGEIKMRRFVFDEEAVRALKARAKSDLVPKPTRTEAVAGFLWKSAVSATAKALSADGGKEGSVLSIAGMAVNLRPRLKEPWPDYSVGNIIWYALSFYHNKQQHHPSVETKMLQEVVGELSRSVAKIDNEFMAKLQGGDGRQEFMRNQEMVWKSPIAAEASKNGSTVMPFTITSAIGLGLYDVDFGWGKPSWVSMTKYTYAVKNMAVLMESPVRNGVEAWLTMHKEEMTILEQEPEFLIYAKNNTHII